MSEAGNVFGFGSLVDLAALARYLGRDDFADDEFALCRLAGHRRLWNIARDNAEHIPGHDHFVCAVTGERYAGFVAVVNIREAVGCAVNGVAFRVSADELARLDVRERNYDRVEITGRLDVALAGPVWAYRGKPAAEARFAAGLARGSAVIDHAYHERVLGAFAGHGEAFLAEYRATTDPPAVPLRRLRRVANPP